MTTTDLERLRRPTILMWACLLLIVANICWHTPAAYPLEGLLLVSAIVVMLVGALAVRLVAGGAGSNPAALAGAGYLAVVIASWGASGWRQSGSDDFATLMIAAAIVTGAAWMLAAADGLGLRRARFVDGFLAMLAAGAILCGVHAALQYFHLYDQTLARLEQEMAGRAPDGLEQAMIHHLRLKRVASIWGDPNVLGTVMGLSVAASLRFVVAGGWMRLAGVAGIAGSVTGIVLSQSRGGVLTALFAVIVFALVTRKRPAAAVAGMTACAALLLAVGTGGAEVGTTSSAAVEHQENARWWTRSDTIRERVNYGIVGITMVKQAPVLGAGLGGVEANFGRLKPPDARESRYLHNWPLQAAAESGLAGLVLFTVFAGLMLWRAWGAARREPAVAAVWVIAAAALWDGLYSLSIHQQGAAALMAVAAGVLLTAGSKPRQGTLGGTRRAASIACAALMAAALVLKVVPLLAASDYLRRAEDFFEAGELPAAQRMFRKAERWTPRDPRPSLGLASIEARTGGFDRALLLLRRTAEIAPDSASVRAQIAGVELRRGNTTASLEAIGEALVRYPAKSEYWRQKAEILKAAGRHGEAVDAAREAVRHAVFDRGEQQAYLDKLTAEGAK